MAAASPATGQTTAAITAADLKTRLYILAADSMLGRQAGTEANIKGTAYIAAEAKRIGLQPAGDNGTFFQDVPMVRRSIAASSTLSVDGQAFHYGTDFTAFDRGAEVKPFNAPAVYGGKLGDEVLITAQQATGKIVVFSPPTPQGGRGGRGGGGRGRGGFGGAPVPEGIAKAAVAVATVGNIGGGFGGFGGRGGGGRVTLKPDSPPDPIDATVTISPNVAAAIFGRPVDALDPGTNGKNVSGRIIINEEKAPGRNVVAIIQGSDAKLKSEYVAIGAHNDHIGIRTPAVDHDSLRAYLFALDKLQRSLPEGERPSPDQIAAIHINVDSLHRIRPARMDSVNNGADDDGSGSVSVLEIAEAFQKAAVKPKRSLLFVWHTAEELGLYGSEYFTDHPTVPRDSIVAQLNMDMVGRGDAADLKGGGPNYLQLVGSRRLSTELGDIVEAVNKKEKSPFTFDYTFDANGHPERIYCRSDHYNYARYGIPITFFTTGLHPDYHRLTDEAQYIDYAHMARVDQLVHDVAETVANLDHRVVVDQPKPDPHGRCVQ